MSWSLVNKSSSRLEAHLLAPPVACLWAGKLETYMIYPSEEFKNLFLGDKENEYRFWKRYIDDIEAAMQGTRKEAKPKVFVDWVNT